MDQHLGKKAKREKSSMANLQAIQEEMEQNKKNSEQFQNQAQKLQGEYKDIFRKSYRDLTSDERDAIVRIKDLARMVDEFLYTLPQSREVSLARTKLEEAVMWAVKSITK
jgi:predicted nuclease with TOPRIM domain